MAGDDIALVRGVGSKVSPLVEELLKEDARTTTALSAKGNYHPPAKPLDLKRYFDPAFAERERDSLWKKVWQYACREEDIPKVGDRLPYSVGSLSYIIVRVAPDQIKAYQNTCMHRATRLCDGQSTGDKIRCPFHGWEWKLDGSLNHIPSRWDFPDLRDEEFSLVEVNVAMWGGFVFINPDANPEPLEKSLGVLQAHFKSWALEDHFTYGHVRKKIRANWKIVMEAFLESYHTVETHRQILNTLADASSQYDVWEDGSSHISRLYSPMAVPSPHLGDEASVIEAAVEFARQFQMPGIKLPELKIDLASSLSPRAQVAQWRRSIFGLLLGRDFSDWPDALMLDAIQYWMFPNFCPWYGEGGPIVYQFLPNGNNPLETIMDIRLMAPKPAKGAPPPSAPITHLDFDDSFVKKALEFGELGLVFDQDMANIPRVQAGVMTAHEAGNKIVLGRYQEMRIQYFHEILNRQLGLDL